MTTFTQGQTLLNKVLMRIKSMMLSGNHPHLPLLGILAVTILTFSPTFFNGFQMEWDDQWMVTNKFTVSKPTWALVKEVFVTPFNGQWGPLNQLMYTFLFSRWAYNPLAFHTASLILHLLNICLVYFGLLRILKECTAWPREKVFQINLLITTLFAIHPLQVETVAWISASKILMYTVFYLLAAHLLIIHIRNKNMLPYIGMVLCSMLSYFSKEQAVTFPMFATLICIWYGIGWKTLRFWKILVPLYLLALCQGLHEIFWVSSYNHYIQGQTYLWWQRFAFVFYSLVSYLFKWITPYNLNWMYPFPMGLGEEIPLWVLAYPVFVGILVFALWKWLCKKAVLSSTAFILIHLMLVIHITVLPRAAVIADRYMYLPVIGFNFLFAYILFTINKHTPALTPAKRIFTICFLLYCMAMSFNRTRHWADTGTLRSHAKANASFFIIN